MSELFFILLFQVVPLLLVVYVLHVLTRIQKAVERIDRRLDAASDHGAPDGTRF